MSDSILIDIISSGRMAHLIRSAKCSSNWTQNDLLAYNIRVVFQDATTFFQSSDLPSPAPSIDDDLLTVHDSTDTRTDDSYAFLRTMHLAMSQAPNEESAVCDFVMNLFRVMHYTERKNKRVARTRKEIPFFICGETAHAQTDVCILDETSQIVLLVQEDKAYLDDNRYDPEPQLIASAIAAFQANNRIRTHTLGVSELESKVMPGITMRGTSPIFYKVPVTNALAKAVSQGIYSDVETVVYAHLPRIPRPACRYREGMKPCDSRRVILTCFEAFKQSL